FYWNHVLDDSVIPELTVTSNPSLQAGVVENNPSVNFISQILQGVANFSPFGRAITGFATNANTVANWFDPGSGSEFFVTESASAPSIASVAFVSAPGIANYIVWSQVGNGWSAP